MNKKLNKNTLNKIEQELLLPGDLNIEKLSKFHDVIHVNQIDYSDLYFQLLHKETFLMEDGKVKRSNFKIKYGVGVRAISDEKIGFSSINGISDCDLLEACKIVRNVSNSKQKKDISFSSKNLIYAPHDNNQNILNEIPNSKKISILENIDLFARKLSHKISKVSVALSATNESVLISGSDQSLAIDVRPSIQLNITIIAKSGGQQSKGMAGFSCNTYKQLESKNLEDYIISAVNQALVGLVAQSTPIGIMPVILGCGWPGILLHESVGHGLEGDAVFKGKSFFKGRIGEKIAASGCTVVDGPFASDNGSFFHLDDEGVTKKNSVLIENGVLKNFMYDKHSAQLMKAQSSGNGRRESYAHKPLTRMTSTYMLPGNYSPEEIIASVPKGIYATNFNGGEVDVTSGKFVFFANEVFLIEKGKITAPLNGAMLMGDGPTILKNIQMLGNDLKFDDGIGMCGKDGQYVSARVGQPTMLINGLTVGGTNFGN